MVSKLNNSLIRGSSVLLIAFGIFNFFNFLFQFSMARILTIEDYGLLATLFAIIYVLLVFSESVQTILTKYSANEDNKGKLKNLFRKSSKRALKISTVLFLFYLLVIIPLAYILKINYLLLALNGLIIFIAFFIPIPRGIMQGKKRFNSLGMNMILEASLKLALGVSLAYIGWKIYGAIIGIILGGLISFGFSFFQLKDIIRSKELLIRTQGIYDYAKPTFLITAIVIVFYSLDVIFARIFFPPEVAGSYAIASILGKVIFWGTLPISKVMFPISANKKNKPGTLFTNSLILVSLGIILLLLLFYFFPGVIIKVFSGKILPDALDILFYVGISFGLISISNLILQYKLSINKVKNYPYLVIFILLEILLLSYFSKDLFQFVIAFITSSIAFLWGVIFLLNEKD